MKEAYARVFPLDDIAVLSRAKGGDGRTVEAYAAVFNVPKEIHDRSGDYTEVIHPSAFNRTLSQGAASRSLYLYNHGLSVVNGQPDSLAQVPIGSPVSVTADGKGLRTVARLNRSALAEATLEAVKAGDVKGYSFRGNAYRSEPQKVPRARRGEALPTVTRMELSLADFGPTPSPYYEEAEILAVRSRGVGSLLDTLSDELREELIRMLIGSTSLGDPERDATSTPEPGPEDSHQPVRSVRSLDLARARRLALRAEVARMEMSIR